MLSRGVFPFKSTECKHFQRVRDNPFYNQPPPPSRRRKPWRWALGRLFIAPPHSCFSQNTDCKEMRRKWEAVNCCPQPHFNSEYTMKNVFAKSLRIFRNRKRLRSPRIDCSLAGWYVILGCRTGPPGWKSIPGLLKRFTNSGSGGFCFKGKCSKMFNKCFWLIRAA